MNRVELERLLADIESDRVERTISLTATEKFCGAHSPFANDMPKSGKSEATLFHRCHTRGIGQRLVIDDQLLQDLAALRSEGQIQPLPMMNVQKWALGGGEMSGEDEVPI